MYSQRVPVWLKLEAFGVPRMLVTSCFVIPRSTVRLSFAVASMLKAVSKSVSINAKICSFRFIV